MCYGSVKANEHHKAAYPQISQNNSRKSSLRKMILRKVMTDFSVVITVFLQGGLM
jgi:hypothetical protein